MSLSLRGELLNLSLAERIQMVEDLWDSIAECPEALTLTEPQKRELEERLAAFRNDPEQGSPWAAVRDRLLNRS